MLFTIKKIRGELIPENKLDVEIIERNYDDSCNHLA